MAVNVQISVKCPRRLRDNTLSQFTREETEVYLKFHFQENKVRVVADVDAGVAQESGCLRQQTRMKRRRLWHYMYFLVASSQLASKYDSAEESIVQHAVMSDSVMSALLRTGHQAGETYSLGSRLH